MKKRHPPRQDADHLAPVVGPKMDDTVIVRWGVTLSVLARVRNDLPGTLRVGGGPTFDGRIPFVVRGPW